HQGGFWPRSRDRCGFGDRQGGGARLDLRSHPRLYRHQWQLPILTAETPYNLWRKGGDAASPFIACAMFTPGYLGMAQRLAVSLEQFGLEHAMFMVPTVHRSI